MTAQLMTAISNRDGDALARMAAGRTEPQRLLDFEAERLVDSLFRQLKQIFPASTQTNLRTDAEEKTAKRQWIAAFAENGIRTREQLSAGVRHARASESPFWPSPGQFIKWCKDSGTVLGVTLVDVMNEFHRYSREKGCIPAVLSASRGLTLSCTGLLPIPGGQCTSASSARQKQRNMPLRNWKTGR